MISLLDLILGAAVIVLAAWCITEAIFMEE